MFPIEIWVQILNEIVEMSYRTKRVRPKTELHLRSVCKDFASHAELRVLAYLFAAPKTFLNNLHLTQHFFQNGKHHDHIFKMSNAIAQRTAVSDRNGSTNLCMEPLYKSMLQYAEENLNVLPQKLRLKFVDYMVYCFSPLAISMKAYKKNSWLSTAHHTTTTPEFNGIPELRLHLMEIYESLRGSSAGYATSCPTAHRRG